MIVHTCPRSYVLDADDMKLAEHLPRYAVQLEVS